MSEEEEKLTVHLTLTAEPSAPRVPLKVSKTASPSDLRRLVSEASKIPLSSLRLIFRGRLIADKEVTEAVAEYKLEDGCVLHCMGKPVKDTASAPVVPPAASLATAGSTVSTTSQPRQAPPAAAPSGDALQIALATLKSSNSAADYLTGVTTLAKILDNIASNPMEEKYRRVKKQNAAFQRRLGSMAGADAAMMAAGFVSETDGGEEVYMMHASAENWPKLVATKAAVDAALAEAKAASSPVMPMAGINPPMGGAAHMMGAGGFGNMPPGMQNAAANLMANPEMLQQMLQNPMVQQMMQNDPRLANNPMLRQSMEQLASNPEMISQISRMMADPNMQSQMQAMMGNPNLQSQMQQAMMGNPNLQSQMQAMMGNPGAMMGNGMGTNNPSAANNAALPPPQQQGDSGRSDQELTEEEMIAEAIRRSLEENNQ